MAKTVGSGGSAVTTTYLYDPRDKLVEVQQASGSSGSILGRFQYDFEGRRIKKIGEEGLRQYVYDDTSLLAEYDSAGLQKAKYDYGSDRLISLFRTDEGRRYFSLDGLRSVVNLTDDTGSTVASYHLDPWGNFRFPTELDSSRNRFAFTGHVFDNETGLYHAKARYFDPKLGRFLTQDSFLGQIDEPPSLHRYFYANANPTRYVDPTGYQTARVTGTAQRIEYREDSSGNLMPVSVTVPTAETSIEVHADPIKQLEYEVKTGQRTPGEAVMAAMDGFEEPMKESMVMMAAPYGAAGVTVAVGPAAAVVLPEAMATVATGTVSGGATAGASTYARARVRGAGHKQAARAAARAIPVGMAAGGAGTYAGILVGPAGAPAAAFASGTTADLAGQGAEMALGQREQIDFAQAAVSGAVSVGASQIRPSQTAWDKGPGPRGLELEFGPSGHRLPKGFTTFDYFDPDTGLATSQKSLNLRDNYRNPAGIIKAGEKAVEAIVNFEEATKRGFRLTADQIKARRLDLIIPKDVATEAQKDALRQVRMLGIDNNISVRIIER